MHSLVPSKTKVRCFPMAITNRKYCSIVTKLISLKSLKIMLSIWAFLYAFKIKIREVHRDASLKVKGSCHVA